MAKVKVKKTKAFPHGKAIKNPKTYEALRRSGKSKSSAARISNWALKKYGKRGKHRRKK